MERAPSGGDPVAPASSTFQPVTSAQGERGKMLAPSAPAFYPVLHPWSGLQGYRPPPQPLPPSWPIMVATASAHHPQPQLPQRADSAPVLAACPAAASALGNPLAALALAVEQHVQHEGSSPGGGPVAHAAQAAAAPASAQGAKRLRQGLAVEPAQRDQALGHWHGSTTPASPAGSSSSTSIDLAASSPYGSAAGFASSSKAVAGSTGMGGATGAGELVVAPQPSFSGLPPVSQPGKRGRRKGSKDGWNAAGAASLAASGADCVGLLSGVHTANLDKYMPATEKVKRNRTVLVNMSSEEKLARRKERARKYSQELRRRQLESIQELLIAARRLNVFQLLVQESADPLLVLSSSAHEEERGRAAGAVLFANAAAAAVLLGRPRGAVEWGRWGEELLGRGLLGYVHVEDRAGVEAALRRVEEQHQEQRVRCRLMPEGGGGVGVEFLLRKGTQGVVCNGRVL